MPQTHDAQHHKSCDQDPHWLSSEYASHGRTFPVIERLSETRRLNFETKRITAPPIHRTAP
jgi:hypothetical protein